MQSTPAANVKISSVSKFIGKVSDKIGSSSKIILPVFAVHGELFKTKKNEKARKQILDARETDPSV